MRLSRRRLLTVGSAACLFGSGARPAEAFRWQGIAMGARVQFVFDHPRPEALASRLRQEIDRLEDVFSLYLPNSELSRLNAEGRLDAPAFELIECLSAASRAHRATEGRFDPTVQPLWQELARAKSRGRRPDSTAVGRARAAIGMERVRFDSSSVSLAPGQALTLNGIAQGHIADSVADLLREAGVDDALVDTGEIVALGGTRGSAAWPVSVVGASDSLNLSGRALATSSPGAMTLDAPGRIGHILDPNALGRDRPGFGRVRQVTVSAHSAAVADALSTALCLASGADEVHRLIARVEGARLENIRVYG